MQKEVLATLGNIRTEKFETPSDILQALKANKRAWHNFRKYSETYKQIRIAFIDGARNRPAEFKKRLKYFIKMTEKNKQFGFGIDEYF